MNSRNQSIVIYLLLFIAIIALVVYSFRQQGGSQDTIAINQVAADIRSGKVERVVEDDNKLTVIYLDALAKKFKQGTQLDPDRAVGRPGCFYRSAVS